jgi:hypothetical protein
LSIFVLASIGLRTVVHDCCCAMYWLQIVPVGLWLCWREIFSGLAWSQRVPVVQQLPVPDGKPECPRQGR